MTTSIEPLARPAGDADVEALAMLLVDAVDSGAAVSFLALSRDEARGWWRQVLERSHARAIFLVARSEGEIIGSVQLHPAWAPNQPHRADVTKLLVHRRARGAGLGRRLMEALEEAARGRGFTLLTLDAKRGSVADALYRKLGWTHVGTVPGFALDPDGTPHDAVLFYKDVRSAEEV
jgi:GNAT superfamily N-acetyltransferase